MAESGLRPAESLLNNRSRRHVLRLMSLPRGNQAKSLPGGDTPMGQHMVHFSEYSGRANRTRGQRLHRRRRVGGAGGEEGGLPTGASALDGWVSGRERGGGVRGGVEEGEVVGREEGAHGVLPGGLRRRVRGDCARPGSGSGALQTTQAWQGSYLHRCASRDRAGDARRTRARTDLRHPGEASDSDLTQAGTRHRD